MNKRLTHLSFSSDEIVLKNALLRSTADDESIVQEAADFAFYCAL